MRFKGWARGKIKARVVLKSSGLTDWSEWRRWLESKIHLPLFRSPACPSWKRCAMAPNVTWLNARGKKCSLRINRLHIAHCQAEVCNMKGHGKACSSVTASDSVVSPDMPKHSRPGSSMPVSHGSGSSSEVMHWVALRRQWFWCNLV